MSASKQDPPQRTLPMFPKEVEDRSSFSLDFRETLRTLEAQTRSWARWGRALLLLGFISAFLVVAFLANGAIAVGDKAGEKPEGFLAWSQHIAEGAGTWITLVITLMGFGYRLILRSWELYDKLLHLRVLADDQIDPETTAEMTKVLVRESRRALKSRRPIIIRRPGSKPPVSPDR